MEANDANQIHADIFFCLNNFGIHSLPSLQLDNDLSIKILSSMAERSIESLKREKEDELFVRTYGLQNLWDQGWLVGILIKIVAIRQPANGV